MFGAAAPLAYLCLYIILGLAMMIWVSWDQRENGLPKAWTNDSGTDWAMLFSFYLWPVVLSVTAYRWATKCIRCSGPLLALLGICLSGCSCEMGDGPLEREWKTTGQVVLVACDTLCLWQYDCDRLPEGETVSSCQQECAAHICTVVDCDAEPSGSDETIEVCLDIARHDQGWPLCRPNDIGISQRCQDAFFPAT